MGILGHITNQVRALDEKEASKKSEYDKVSRENYGGQAIGRAKKEGRNSYRGFWYWFYGKSPRQTGPRAGRAVL